LSGIVTGFASTANAWSKDGLRIAAPAAIHRALAVLGQAMFAPPESDWF
jgi:hypothetical protein